MRNTRSLLLLLLLSLSLLLCGCGAEAPDSSCQVDISCATALGYGDLDPALAELLPADGVLFSGTVEFTAGENAYAVLSRALTQANLHYEAAADSAYFDAVSNLYTGDCGDLSGWMYSVNGEFLMEAVNQYQPAEGDVIALQYTCDMGADLGYVFQ